MLMHISRRGVILALMSIDRFVTGTRLAALSGVSNAAITKAKKAGKILMGEDNLYDLTHPLNLTYLHRQTKSRDPSKKKLSPGDAAVLSNRKAVEALENRKPESSRKPPPDYSVPDYDPADIGKRVIDDEKSRGRRRRDRVDAPYDGLDLSGLDLTSLDKVEVDKLKVIEAIDSARLKNDQLRRTLIDRKLVSVVLGKIHTVDVQEFLAIPIRFAPVAAGLCGRDDEETIHKLESRLNAELYKCLNHVKRIIDDFLTDLETATDEEQDPE